MKPRTILVAMASFKGTLRSIEACAAVRDGLNKSGIDSNIIVIPLADGGTGTVDAILSAMPGKRISQHAHDPLHREMVASWGLLDNQTAVAEMAAASGLALLGEEERNPMRTSSYGTGEILLAAMEKSESIVLGIGDSATVDGGLGACQALGAKFFDAVGREITDPISGGHLHLISRMDTRDLRQRIGGKKIRVLCDVNNPLLGSEGAAAVFGPQKGATPEMVRELESGLAHAFDLIEAHADTLVRDIPGAGAAGGFGAGAVALLNAEIVSGTEHLLKLQEFEEKLCACDFLITGEGRLDHQSMRGKATGRVLTVAAEKNIPCVLITGLPLEDNALLGRTQPVMCLALRNEPGTVSTTEAFEELQQAAREVGEKLCDYTFSKT